MGFFPTSQCNSAMVAIDSDWSDINGLIDLLPLSAELVKFCWQWKCFREMKPPFGDSLVFLPLKNSLILSRVSQLWAEPHAAWRWETRLGLSCLLAVPPLLFVLPPLQGCSSDVCLFLSGVSHCFQCAAGRSCFGVSLLCLLLTPPLSSCSSLSAIDLHDESQLSINMSNYHWVVFSTFF